MLELRLHFAVFLQHGSLAGVEARLKHLHLRLKLAETGNAAHRVFKKRLFGRVRLGMLSRGADRWLFLDDQLAVVRGHLAENDLEESGLAGAVRPHHAHALALVHAEADVREDVLVSVMHRYVLKIKHIVP